MVLYKEGKKVYNRSNKGKEAFRWKNYMQIPSETFFRKDSVRFLVGRTYTSSAEFSARDFEGANEKHARVLQIIVRH